MSDIVSNQNINETTLAPAVDDLSEAYITELYYAMEKLTCFTDAIAEKLNEAKSSDKSVIATGEELNTACLDKGVTVLDNELYKPLESKTFDKDEALKTHKDFKATLDAINCYFNDMYGTRVHYQEVAKLSTDSLIGNWTEQFNTYKHRADNPYMADLKKCLTEHPINEEMFGTLRNLLNECASENKSILESGIPIAAAFASEAAPLLRLHIVNNVKDNKNVSVTQFIKCTAQDKAEFDSTGKLDIYCSPKKGTPANELCVQDEKQCKINEHFCIMDQLISMHDCLKVNGTLPIYVRHELHNDGTSILVGGEETFIQSFPV